jgi:hypothetical protein
MLWRISGPKRDGVMVGWRKLHNEELHDLCSSQNMIRIIKLRRMRWAEHVKRMGEKRNVYRLLVGKPEGKRPLARPRQLIYIYKLSLKGQTKPTRKIVHTLTAYLLRVSRICPL